MTGKQHLFLGTYIGITAGIFIGGPEGLAFASASAFGSLIPDIDSPSSLLGRRIPVLSGLIRRIFGHRGFMHAPFLYLLLGFALYVLRPGPVPYHFFMGILAGCLSHLAQDLMTRDGIPLFYPLMDGKVNIGFFKSGSRADPAITNAMAVLWTFGLWICAAPITV